MSAYLDYAATTPVDPRVAALMSEYLTIPALQANAASATHAAGFAVNDRVELARASVAVLIGAQPREIIFTSGATEANNLALLGSARAARRAGVSGHIVSARTEHKSVLDACKQLQKDGHALTLIEPHADGRITPESVLAALRADTLLVSIMLANNEIGVVNEIAAIAQLCRSRGVLVHTDAAQAAGKLPLDVGALGVDLLSLTAHKFYGPKGIGALYVREAVRPKLAPIQFGGGHERGLRSGTLPTHQIAGFGRAAELAREHGASDAAHARDLVARLWKNLETITGLTFNGSREHRLPGLLNVSVEGVEGESLITGLVEIAVSTGSACSSATREPSYVLRALGRSTELAQSSLRLSVGRFTTAAEIDVAANSIIREVSRLRVLAGGAAIPGAPAGLSALHQGRAAFGGLLDRVLNPAAQHYFLSPPRPCQFPSGNAPPGIRRGDAGRQADGTRVSFELEIADGFVRSARFSAYGCPHTLAVVSWLCEVTEGARLDAGLPGTPTDWAPRFEVPAEKLGRLLIVEDALREAFTG